MSHTQGKLQTDTYRVRLVFEKCIHTTIGNWRDIQELNSRIFFGVSVNKSKVEKSFTKGCKILNSHDALLETRKDLLEGLKALFKLMDDGELVRNTKNDNSPTWTLEQLAFVATLKDAHQAIAKAEIEERIPLIAATSPMDMLLSLLASGEARIEKSKTTILVEFCWRGIRYPCSDCDWAELVKTIGYEKIEAAIVAAKE